MDEKRVKLAEKNFSAYLRENKIRKLLFEEIVFRTYLRNASESLRVAEELFKNQTSSLWVVVSSYYSMFYAACAYIYKKGYKAGAEIVHQVINEALIVLARHDLEKHFLEEYEEEKEKALSASGNLPGKHEMEKAKALSESGDLLSNYEYEKAKRTRFQYETTEKIKESKAKTSLERAKNFAAVMRQLLRE